VGSRHYNRDVMRAIPNAPTIRWELRLSCDPAVIMPDRSWARQDRRLTPGEAKVFWSFGQSLREQLTWHKEERSGKFAILGR